MKKRTDLPPLSDNDAVALGIKVDRDGLVRCRVCRCTEREPCFPPCAWVRGTPDLCDGCLEAVVAVIAWQQDAHRPSKAALFREVARMRKKA